VSPVAPVLLSICRRARKGRGRRHNRVLSIVKRRAARATRRVVRFVMRRESPLHPTRPHAPLRRAGESRTGLAISADGMKKPPRLSRAACLPGLKSGPRSNPPLVAAKCRTRAHESASA
jgi:hypothetical protein